MDTLNALNPFAFAANINPAGQDHIPNNRHGIGYWLGRSVKPVIAVGTALYLAPNLVAAALGAVAIYTICVLAEKLVTNWLPNPFNRNSDSHSDGRYRFEPADASQQLRTPPEGTPDCPICLTGFDAAPAVNLTGCTNPSWLHPDCLSGHLNARIQAPVEDIELKGRGVLCPLCPSAPGEVKHVLPTNVLGKYITDPQTQQLVQDFRLAGQYRLFREDPNSRQLDSLVMKKPVCPVPECQKEHPEVNLRDQSQLRVTCDGVKAVDPGPGDSLVRCTEIFCASCQNPPHRNQTCAQADINNNQQIMDLRAKLSMYQDAKRHDNQARPCPKCDTPIIREPGGCNLIQRNGEHRIYNNAQDRGTCNHNICFECLKDWPSVYGNSGHRYFNCTDPGNRQVVYDRKIREIKAALRAAGARV